jgi:LEA14-like dessication related protein
LRTSIGSSAVFRPRRSGATLLLAVMVGALAGCSLFSHWETPTLSVVSIRLGRSDLFQQHLLVRMNVDNPNNRELPVEGLSYVLEVNGEECAHGESGASFLVPARGDAEFDMNVTANAAAALLRMFAHGNQAPVQYRIRGKVRLSSGLLRSVAFDQQGLLPLR